MRVLNEAVRKIDWGLMGLIAIVACITFAAARFGSITRDGIQADDIRRVEEKIDRLSLDISK